MDVENNDHIIAHSLYSGSLSCFLYVTCQGFWKTFEGKSRMDPETESLKEGIPFQKTTYSIWNLGSVLRDSNTANQQYDI